MSDKIVLKLDASALKSGACDTALFNAVVEGYREPMMFNDTNYGIAFHAFASRMVESDNNFAEAYKAAMHIFNAPTKIRDEKKTRHLTEKHLINTCVTYFNDVETRRSNFDYIINPQAKCWRCKGMGFIEQIKCPVCDGERFRAQPLVEVTFSIKVYEDDLFIVYICGTIDRIGKIKNGAYCIRDYKTTSSWDANKFLSSFRCSVQFKLYTWALKKMAANNPDSILAHIAKFPLVAFIDGIFLKSKQETEFHSSDAIQYKDWEMEEFEQLMMQQVIRLVSLAKSRMPEKNGKMLGLCYTGFYCKYHDICHAVDSVVAEFVLKKNFIQKPYDPLNFRD